MTKYREDFPLNWLCGACESTCIISSNSSVKEDLPRTVKLNFSNMVHHDSKVSAGYTKLSRGARGNWCEKEVGTGKTKYLWTQEVIKMPSVDKKGGLNSRVCRLRSSGHLNPPRPGNTRSSPMVQKLKEWSKYDFLWGLYRCLKLDIARCTLDFNGIREDNMVVDMDIDIHDAQSNAIVKVIEEVDMEIDMVGGKTVGTLDIVISKESVQNGCGISGAEATAIVLPNPNITAVSGKIHPSLVIKKEICDDIPPGFGVSSREISSDIPPGFGVSSSQMCSDIPPGFAVPIKIEKPAL